MTIAVQTIDSGYEVGSTYRLNSKEYTILSIEPKEKITYLELSDVGADTPEVSLELSKEQQLLDLTIEVNGKLFSADDASLSRIDRAIRVGELLGKTTTKWKLNSNTTGDRIQEVTIDELKEVLAKGMIAIGEILGVSE